MIVRQHISKFLFSLLLLIPIGNVSATQILIPMDMAQKNHLKAYGIAYFTVGKGIDVSWLLNYRGGSFMCAYAAAVEDECLIRGVSYEVISDLQGTQIINEIASMENNMDEIKLT